MKTGFEQIVDVQLIGKKGQKQVGEILKLAEQEQVKPASEDQEKVLFLGIDIQNDFMEGGALGVPGALQDVKNITNFIYRYLHKITSIAVSLDTHEPLQIFHPSWWQNEAGEHPSPLTIITSEEVEKGRWVPIYEKEVSIEYVENLEKLGKKQLCIWPYHCIEGTFGAALESQFANLIYFHSVARKTTAKRIVKGLSPATEMYGIFRPEYSREDITNTEFLQELTTYDRIFVAGEAKSHCVLESLHQLIEFFVQQNGNPANIFVLEDCMSSIPGFEEETEKTYKKFAEEYGIQLVQSVGFEW